jgi:hypothetical protein
MATFHDPSNSAAPYKDPTPLPAGTPNVAELGTTSAPLKSAAFFLGAYCKDYSGARPRLHRTAASRSRRRRVQRTLCSARPSRATPRTASRRAAASRAVRRTCSCHVFLHLGQLLTLVQDLEDAGELPDRVRRTLALP